MNATNMDFYAEIDRLERKLEKQRAAIIEECARVAEFSINGECGKRIAKDIRALKDKP